ncbi:hypothetical protein Pcinc_002138 [Petrolisthes cinctipes]|uniref:Ionotropic glutamate receptor C-terminal domain-containing protein n=1 Tax=Petrolisthes cinctipes TaxID=88211 RepID=A0AAE1GK06_PETCI|nr:hypothetical protein Pcinc_002138 [Petrolisthes cinctipes]
MRFLRKRVERGSERTPAVSFLHSMQQHLSPPSTITTPGRRSLLWIQDRLSAVSIQPPQGVLKTVIGLWLLLSLILATVYRGNLKAMLILPKVTLPFNNLEELSEAGLPVWVPLLSVVHNAAYRAEPETLLWHFNRTIYNTDRPNNLSWGIADFLAGQHVMVGPRSAMVQILHAHFSKTGQCNTYLMAEGFLKSNTGVLFFAKGSKLKAEFNLM